MRPHFLFVALTASICTSQAYAKAVFAHYMVGTVSAAHAQIDIDNAVAIGLDGFALNVGDPTQAYAINAVSSLFNYAATKPSFKLFFSLDMYASGGSGQPVSSYTNLVNTYMTSSAYYKGPNGLPFLSTFSDGGLTNAQWNAFKSGLNGGKGVYFVPDFDGTQGYYSADPGWWAYWGSVVDGLFSWESAWPAAGVASGAGDVSKDVTVAGGAKNNGKTYMISLSSLQYKNAYGSNWYRLGDLNLPNRMSNILSMSPQPDFVEIITWNDGPESHYIGNNWPESNSDAAPSKYMTSPHTAWQPLVSSFIRAYKSNAVSSSMTPGTGTAQGAIWYKTILQSSICPADTQPQGFNTGTNAVNWAVVLAPGKTQYKIRVSSNGSLLQVANVYPGLNTGMANGVSAGAQMLELVDGSGNVVSTASGGPLVSAGCPEGIYDMNYKVVGLA